MFGCGSTNFSKDKHFSAKRSWQEMFKCIGGCSIMFFLFVNCLSTGAAEEIQIHPVGHHPQICLSFWNHVPKKDITTDKAWGWGNARREHCPPNHAIFDRASTCCALPAVDILTDEHVQVTSQCPPDYVATGEKVFLGQEQIYDRECTSCTRKYRCTRINTERYQLGEPTPGAYWGAGSKSWANSTRFMKREIPVAIRYGIGRKGRYSWDFQGCVGLPWGSLLAGNHGWKECQNMLFRQLQFRGRQGDPPQGIPVQMFPRCRAISDYLSPDARCILE